MRLLRNSRLLFALFLLGIMVVFLFVSVDYPQTMRIGPLGVTIIGIVTLLLVAASEVSPRLASKLRVNLMGGVFGGRIPEPDADEEADETGSKPLVILIVWIIGFAISIFLLGFLISIPLFVFLFLRFARGVSWARSLVLTAATFGGLYLLFPFLLNLRLFEGVLFGAIIP